MFSDYLREREIDEVPGRGVKPWVIAHRGYSGAAPENTMAAVDAARLIGCDFIEVDLHVTADGVPVVVHDPTLQRTTDIQGTIAHMSYDRISLADAGYGRGLGYAGQRIPRLDAMLKNVAEMGGRMLLELKGEWSPGAVARVGQEIAEVGMADRVILQSFNVRSVEVCRDIAPHVPRGLLRLIPREEDMGIAQRLEVVAVNPSIRGFHARRDFVEEVLGRDLAVFVYTTDTPRDWEKLVGAGVTGIITNQPGRLQGFLAAKYDIAHS